MAMDLEMKDAEKTISMNFAGSTPLMSHPLINAFVAACGPFVLLHELVDIKVKREDLGPPEVYSYKIDCIQIGGEPGPHVWEQTFTFDQEDLHQEFAVTGSYRSTELILNRVIRDAVVALINSSHKLTKLEVHWVKL